VLPIREVKIGEAMRALEIEVRKGVALASRPLG
jgi:hypothetical protein